MSQKPSILIFLAHSAPVDLLQPVLWGIEEEGVPVEIHEAGNGSIQHLAKRAADTSAVNVGIALGDDGLVTVHHRDLPAETPLFSVDSKSAHSLNLRCLGINAARLVKGQPLVFYEQPELNPALSGAVNDADRQLEELVALVLGEIARGR